MFDENHKVLCNNDITYSCNNKSKTFSSEYNDSVIRGKKFATACT